MHYFLMIALSNEQEVSDIEFAPRAQCGDTFFARVCFAHVFAAFFAVLCVMAILYCCVTL